MKPCQENPKTIPPQETQQELPLQHNNENTVVDPEAQVIQQIGQILTQISYFCALATLLHTAQQSSLGTPKTVEALSFALWVTASHLTNTLGRLKTLIFTLPVSLKIIPSRGDCTRLCNDMQHVIDDVCIEYFGVMPAAE